jgi:hypothetical protein
VNPKASVGGVKAHVCVTLRWKSNFNALHFFANATLALTLTHQIQSADSQTANTQQCQLHFPQECQFGGDCAPWLSQSHSKDGRTSSLRKIGKALICGKCNCLQMFV